MVNKMSNTSLINEPKPDRVTTPQKDIYYYGSLLTSVTLPDSDKYPLLMENLVLQTAYLKRCEKPISLILLGMVGSGKTRLLSLLAKSKCVSYVNDITPKYLVEFLEKVKKNEKKFLAIPDFIPCMSHSKTTRSTLTSILRSMTEEGVSDLSDYHLEFKSEKPVRAGLITAITTESYYKFHKDWKNTGFLSRLLPFSFNHSPATQNRIRNNIDSGQPDSIAKLKLKPNRNPKEIIMPEYLLRQLHVYQDSLSKSSGSLPYRHQIQLIALAEALAVWKGESELTQDDIDTVAMLCKWINYDFNPV